MLNLVAKDVSHNIHLVKTTKVSHRKRKHVSIPKYDKNMQKAIAKRLQDDSIVALPRHICNSIAKVKCLIIEYIKDTEHRPINDNELIDYAEGAINDEDIYNYHTYGQPYVSLSDFVTNDNGEKETLDETISSGQYEQTEMDDILYESLYLIDPKERSLLIDAYGLEDKEKCSLFQLSKMYHLTLDELMEHLSTAYNNLKKVMLTMM